MQQDRASTAFRLGTWMRHLVTGKARNGCDQILGHIIAEVRRRLPDNESFIVDSPIPFNRMWWPSHDSELLADGLTYSGPLLQEFKNEFFIQIEAIEACLEKAQQHRDLSDFREPERSDKKLTAAEQAGQDMYRGIHQRAKALSVWEQIIFPLHRRDNILIRLHVSDAMGGPVIEAVHINDFLRGVCIQTSNDQLQIEQLKYRLARWRDVAFVTIAIIALFLIRALA